MSAVINYALKMYVFSAFLKADMLPFSSTTVRGYLNCTLSPSSVPSIFTIVLSALLLRSNLKSMNWVFYRLTTMPVSSSPFIRVFRYTLVLKNSYGQNADP